MNEKLHLGDPPYDRGPIVGIPQDALKELHATIARLTQERDAAWNKAIEAALAKSEVYLNDALRPPPGWTEDQADWWGTGGIDHLLAVQSAIRALKRPEARDEQ